MAEPISKIRDVSPSPEEKEAEQLEELKQTIAQDESGFKEILEFVKLLHDAGALEAVNSAMKAKEDIAKTFLNEWRKEPTTNAINNLMISGQLLTETKPEQTEAMIGQMKSAASEADKAAKDESIVGLFGLMKAMKDPDVNRALRYGIAFLKEMGKGLK
ncbi:helical membrane plugin domain-containing protein [Listeria kieliensis]